MRTAWDWCWRWYYGHGVPGNLAASAIWGVPSAALGARLWFRHVRPHLRLVREIHAKLHETVGP